MARERYLVNSGEDTIHSNEIVLNSKKEIRKNWWYYNKFIILGIVIGVAVVGSFIYSMVTKENPDYQIGVLTAYTWPDEVVTDFENYVAEYGEDLNGDGKVLVGVNLYIIGNAKESSSETDYNTLQASMARFTADSSTFENMIYIHDEESFDYLAQSGLEGYFRYNDGTPMPDIDTDYENAMIGWAEVKAFDAFRSASFESEMATAEDLNVLFQRYRVSFRNLVPAMEKKENVVIYYHESDALWSRLINDKKIVRAEAAGSEG